jgi:hypothetical protein
MAALMIDPIHDCWVPSEVKSPSIFVLPAELRNQIYGFLYTSSGPIRVYFHQDPASRVPKAIIKSEVIFPVALFLTGRQLSAEAISVFYSSNVFLLTRKIGTEGFIRPCFISALVTFFDTVGSHATLLRNVIFDTQNICGSVCHRTYLDWKTRLFDPMDGILEITELLRNVWDRNLNCMVEMIDIVDVSEYRARYWQDNPELPRNRAVMAVIHSLMKGQLTSGDTVVYSAQSLSSATDLAD